MRSEDDVELVSIIKLVPEPIPPKVERISARKPDSDSDDEVQLIKVERINRPTLAESQLKLPPEVAKEFFKTKDVIS